MSPNARRYLQEGLALHKQGKFSDAEALYGKVLALEPNHFDALHLTGTCALQTGQYQRSAELIRQAVAINPNFAEAHNNLGSALYRLGDFEGSLGSYDRAIALKPGFAEAYCNRGNALKELKRAEAALASYEKAISYSPGYVAAHSGQGNALIELKRFEAAIESFGKAIALKPDHAEAHGGRGNALRELGRLEEALADYDKAVALKPEYAELHNNRGIMLDALVRYDEALASFDRAIELKRNYAAAYSNRGHTLAELKKFEAAIECYDKAIAVQQDYAPAYYNRGMALFELKRFEAALSSYDQAIALRPTYAEAYKNRGNLLTDWKRYEEAVASYDKAISLDSDADYVHGGRVHAKMMMCDWQHWERDTRELFERLDRGARVSTPFPVLSVSGTSRARQRSASRSWMLERCPPNDDLATIEKGPKRKKIRIGYFSADLRNHAVAWLIAELIEKHDRSLFEVIAFSFGGGDEDEMRKRLEKAFDRFIDVRPKSDREVTLLARQLGLDIAVDLSGFTQGCRTNIFARRAAPVQVSYIGFTGTMAASYIDYVIGDPLLIPPAHQDDYAEKIVRLPDTYFPYDTKKPISNRLFTRQEAGLPADEFVFCCLNNNYKIMPDTFDSWMRILKRVPGSVLWLLQDNATSARNLRKEAESRGVDAGRLVFASRVPMDEHLARHRLADLFLDTLPYTAHTTATDALWTGLPIVTRIGTTFAGRVAASLLSAIGLPDLITETQQAYEDLAVDLATDRPRLESIRRRLADNRRTSPLFDIGRYARNIEAAYVAMYDRYQNGLEPAHIDVPAQKA